MYQVRSWFLAPHSAPDSGTVIEDFPSLAAAQARQRQLDRDPRRFTWIRDQAWNHILRDGRIIPKGAVISA